MKLFGVRRLFHGGTFFKQAAFRRVHVVPSSGNRLGKLDETNLAVNLAVTAFLLLLRSIQVHFRYLLASIGGLVVVDQALAFHLEEQIVRTERALGLPVEVAVRKDTGLVFWSVHNNRIHDSSSRAHGKLNQRMSVFDCCCCCCCFLEGQQIFFMALFRLNIMRIEINQNIRANLNRSDTLSSPTIDSRKLEGEEHLRCIKSINNTKK